MKVAAISLLFCVVSISLIAAQPDWFDILPSDGDVALFSGGPLARAQDRFRDVFGPVFQQLPSVDCIPDVFQELAAKLADVVGKVLKIVATHLVTRLTVWVNRISGNPLITVILRALLALLKSIVNVL